MRVASRPACLLAAMLAVAAWACDIPGIASAGAATRPGQVADGNPRGLASATTAASRWPSLAAKLDPRLLDVVAAGASEPIPVWLAFSDKGERDASDLAARLAVAEAALTPRARARRLRAQVRPLVDYRDLPIAPDYLFELGQRGLGVVAFSRWLNRAAVRVPAARLAELAGLPWKIGRASCRERVSYSV